MNKLPLILIKSIGYHRVRFSRLPYFFYFFFCFRKYSNFRATIIRSRKKNLSYAIEIFVAASKIRKCWSTGLKCGTDGRVVCHGIIMNSLLCSVMYNKFCNFELLLVVVVVIFFFFFMSAKFNFPIKFVVKKKEDEKKENILCF